MAAAGIIDITFLTTIKTILNLVIPILITLALALFIWGVITYVISPDEEKKKQGRQRIIWGIIGLFVIIAIWGIVLFLMTIFGVGGVDSNLLPLPKLPPLK